MLVSSTGFRHVTVHRLYDKTETKLNIIPTTKTPFGTYAYIYTMDAPFELVHSIIRLGITIFLGTLYSLSDSIPFHVACFSLLRHIM